MPERKISNIALCLLTALLLVISGCVSTTTSTASKKDSAKALDDHIQLGLNYIRSGNLQLARSNLLEALEIDKRSAGANHAMALLLQQEQENKLAEDYYKKAISYDKSFTRARNNYALFLLKLERYKDAYKQFKIASEDVNYRLRYQVFFNLGVSASKVGKLDEAKAAWEKAIVLSPRFVMPYLELAEYFYNQEQFSEAQKHLEIFESRSEPQARSLWLAVRIEDHFGNEDAAISKGLALRKLFPDSEETRQYRAWLNDEATD